MSREKCIKIVESYIFSSNGEKKNGPEKRAVSIRLCASERMPGTPDQNQDPAFSNILYSVASTSSAGTSTESTGTTVLSIGSTPVPPKASIRT